MGAGRIILRVGLSALLVGAGMAPRLAQAQAFCRSCEVQLGFGGTYHFWGTTGGVVLPVSVTWSESRYELGLFRVANQQTVPDRWSHSGRVVAEPYWGISLSRRWRLFSAGPVRGFIGFGLAGRTESDLLSATRWDFASQLGVRFRLPGNHAIGELAVRHWSNAGIRLPNHGQDFATLTVQLNSDFFGAGAGRNQIDPALKLARSPPADASAAPSVDLP
jgi:hypothetical protein